jgi:hypothetical protein
MKTLFSLKAVKAARERVRQQRMLTKAEWFNFHHVTPQLIPTPLSCLNLKVVRQYRHRFSSHEQRTTSDMS